MVVELRCGCRVGDEKEGVVKQLQQERHQFEKHIGDVLGQQEALLKERESMSSILFSCMQPSYLHLLLSSCKKTCPTLIIWFRLTFLVILRLGLLLLRLGLLLLRLGLLLWLHLLFKNMVPSNVIAVENTAKFCNHLKT